MEPVDVLIKKHAELRRRVEALGSRLGRESGTGWSDLSNCDIRSFREAVAELRDEMLAHEDAEEKTLAEIWDKRGGRPELRTRLGRAHETLNCLLGVLKAAAECSDGLHVYALRTVTARLKEALEAHLDYEEKHLFPMVRRAGRERTGKRPG